jgi:predicted RNA binding protein YcfA (HicA-like mRNA interferase family)
LAKDYYRELVRLLEKAGWNKIPGGKDSHEKWSNSHLGRVVIVPRSKSRHTANEVPQASWFAEGILARISSFPGLGSE